MNWAEMLGNPRATVLKRTIHQLLGERYIKHAKIIDRVSHHLVTEEDMRALIEMMADTYELGYLKSVEDHRAALAKAGLQAKIVSPQDH